MTIKVKFTKAIIRISLFSICMFMCAAISNAATYYVSPSGSASWPNCTNVNTPCSAKTAFANAVADDIVLFRGGTYNVGADDGSGYAGALNPANSGTSGHPITFQAYPGETPVLNGDWNNNSNEMCVVLGTGDGAVSWITYDGFTITANNGVHSGGIRVGGSSTPSGSGFVVKNCTVIAGSTPFAVDDNRDGIAAAGADYVTISNNRVAGFKMTGGSNDNFAAIKIYITNHLTISNNELYNSQSGISFKRYSSNVTIAYNYVHDCYESLHANPNTGYSGNYNTWSIHDNVFYVSAAGGSGCGAICFATDSGPQVMNDTVIYNNTIYNVHDASATLTDVVRLLYYNNISLGVAYSNHGAWNTTFNTSTITEADYNQWGSGTFDIRLRRGGSETDYSSLSSWKASTELIGGGHPGVGDLASIPLFQNGSGNYSLLGDFRLQANSPCKVAGKGGVDMGANIALVGLSASGKIPNPPSNLQ